MRSRWSALAIVPCAALLVRCLDASPPAEPGDDGGTSTCDAESCTAVDATSDAADAGTPISFEPLCAECDAGLRRVHGACVPENDPLVTGCASGACDVTHGTPTCVDGGCVATCHPGWGSCDGDPKHCDTRLTTTEHCGSCTTKCAQGQVCANGTCMASCPAGQTNCGGTGECQDLTSSALACGSCNITCDTPKNGRATCTNGICNRECPPGFSECNGQCVELSRDPAHCGSCNASCSGPCENGACVLHCSPGFTWCPGTGCTFLATDTTSCGACGHSCSFGQVCASGGCVDQTALVLVPNLAEPEDLIIDGGYVYFSTLGPGAIARVALTGGAVAQLTTGQAKPMRLAIDDTWIYWSNQLGGSIARMRKDGSGATEIVATAAEPLGVAVDATYVYWVDSVGVKRSSKSGAGDAAPSTGTLLKASNAAGELQLEGGALFADLGDCNLWRIPTPSGTPSAIKRTDCSGNTFFHVSTDGVWLGSRDIPGRTPTIVPVEWVSPDGTHRERTPGAVHSPYALSSRARCGVYETSSVGGLGLALRGSDLPATVTTIGASTRRIVRSGGYLYFTDHGHDGAADGALYRVPEP